MREIAWYIAVVLQAPITASRLLDVLEEKINSLSQFPNRIPLTPEEPWRSKGVHRMSVENYYIYFYVDDTARKVQVFAVMYAKRNQKTALSSLP